MSLRKLLFVGKPGAGKGTQADFLVPFGFKHISTGELIREGFRKRSPILMPYKESYDAGDFIPDPEIFSLLRQEMIDLERLGLNGYTLDGAIRNVNQAREALKEGLIGEVLFFDVSDEMAINRMHKRRRSEGRGDDSPESIPRKIRQYKTQTEPVLHYLASKNLPIYRIDASPPAQEVNYNVLKILGLK